MLAIAHINLFDVLLVGIGTLQRKTNALTFNLFVLMRFYVGTSRLTINKINNQQTTRQ